MSSAVRKAIGVLVVVVIALAVGGYLSYGFHGEYVKEDSSKYLLALWGSGLACCGIFLIGGCGAILTSH